MYRHGLHSLVILLDIPAFREYLGDFENADRIMKDGFLLGAHHGMTIEDVDHVCNLLKRFADLKLKV